MGSSNPEESSYFDPFAQFLPHYNCYCQVSLMWWIKKKTQMTCCISFFISFGLFGKIYSFFPTFMHSSETVESSIVSYSFKQASGRTTHNTAREDAKKDRLEPQLIIWIGGKHKIQLIFNHPQDKCFKLMFLCTTEKQFFRYLWLSRHFL